MDKRIRKSKKAIEDALISLMAEEDFESITINSIAEKADVNRGTIYLHYKDKYDLLEQCIEREINELLISCLPEGSGVYPSKNPLLRTFKYLEKNSFFYHTLLTNNGVPTFRNKLLNVMKDGMREQLNLNELNQNMNKEFLIQFWSSAAIGVIEWWIIQSMPFSAEEITEQLWILLERNQILPTIE
ncbi:MULTISPECIES: TetR/AcrR family transcriptional regulator [unclassified Bacillus (in: firmicutes)]|uniref:TetR/AcrR family transcriptional regulator n=1 Tax=Bacillaceae TaxID=186817 RepID=UPI000BF13193|nr:MULTISPECIES: TetR/AcrR family transcriptional regulator [unclassified Bacillus (in: firmicutes)]PEJ60152.1 TetR family transcriptional regulator [Bacillus sp. AFS002410]PEL07587.1 TetR family transcriptional regulator [Bacillus sp. AFS017336]QKE72954.1 TetR/AcrR family transcriptional regulator [Arthrobacter citreus]